MSRLRLSLLCSFLLIDGACSRRRDVAPQAAVEPLHDASVARVCRLLQRELAERRSACCGGRSGGHLEPECVRLLGAAVSAGSIALDDARIQSCSDALARQFVGCDWVTPSQSLPPAECRELTRGRLGLGSFCRSSLECTSPLHCEGLTPSKSGRCAAPLPVGAVCHPPADALASHLFAAHGDSAHPTCAGACSFVTHRCEAAASSGAAPCSGGADSRACAQPSGDTARLQPAGAPCRTDFDCRVGGCSGEPPICGMKCAVSLAERTRFSSRPPLVLPRRSRAASDRAPAAADASPGAAPR
jgi:hypothetical protein